MAKRSLNLVIGCGGSGLTTLSSLNRLLVQNPAMLPRLSNEVYYLAVDTEVEALDKFEEEIKGQMGQYPAPFMDRIQLSHNMNILNEMIRPNFIEPFSKQQNAKGLMRLREHWWFDGNGNPFVAPRVTNLIKGAGQCPPASYGLAWFYLDEIGDAIKRIVNHMVAHGYGDPTQLKNMNLVIVAGLSGGTGRGCWNLIAFKVRDYLLSKYKVTVPPVGVFFDANVYESVARDNEGQQLALEVNSLTGLSELSCWMVNGGKAGTDCFKYSLPNVKSPDRVSTDVLKVNLDLNPTAGAPVSSAFLVCGKSESAILDNNRQYHEMAGAALYAMIANPLLPDLTGKQMIIDRDCSIIKLTPDYLGIGDLVGYYAEKMSLASQALSVNFSNSKLSYVFGAKDKTQATTFKKMFDQILNGEPAVVIDKSLYNDDGTPNWQIFNQNLQQTYIVSDLISDLRKIEAEFDTKIGIPNANTDKRERLISDEVNANNAETSSISDLWLDTIREGIKKTMKLYPDLPEIKVERRYNDAEQRDNVDIRPVGA